MQLRRGPNFCTATQTVVNENTDNDAGPSAYPVTPMNSPIAPAFSHLPPVHVNDEVPRFIDDA